EWLTSLARRDCLYRFRFYAEELADLTTALEIPDPFYTQNHSRFSALEALCLLLARFKSASDLYDLSMKYRRPECSISEIVNELSIFLHEKWKHLLSFDTTGLLTPECLDTYAYAIYQAGAPLRWVWGFIDCTIRSICHPEWLQGQLYNGYKKVHAMKFQAVKL
ncbi:hypothetical protein DFH07DRAFT_699513, partial [Mycena maculata]